MTIDTVAWKACITVIQVVSISSTIIRLVHRWYTRRVWWDDRIAIIPLLGNIVYLVVMWKAVGNIKTFTSTDFIFSSWLDTTLFYTIVWVSRISLGMSIARIFPPKHPCRRFAFVLATLFLIIYLANVLMTTFECYKSSHPWYDMAFATCLNTKGGLAGIYTTMVLDLLADLSLVISPLTMLWKIKLPKQQRPLILALFSSSLLPLISSVIYCIIWGLSPRIGIDAIMILQIMSQLQVGISLLVCNLLVVVMLFYRIVRREDISDPALEPHPPTPPPNLQPPSTEESKSASTNITTAQTRDMESTRITTGISASSNLTSSRSIVLTSIYDDSLQHSSYLHPSSARDIQTLSTSRFDDETTAPSIPAWSFSDKSITNSCS